MRFASPMPMPSPAQRNPISSPRPIYSSPEWTSSRPRTTGLIASRCSCARASDVRLAEWAATTGLAPATVSRGFRAAFGVPPARYRAEARARRAFAALSSGDDPLVEIALACGFADQAHFSRAIVALTGFAPTAWRRTSNPFKTTSASVA